MRLIFVIPLVVIIFLVSTSIFSQYFYARVAKGHVYDCQTNQAIEGAAVSLHAKGWGISDGRILWDKAFTGKSDSQGFFTLKFKGSANVFTATKEGFLQVNEHHDPNMEIEIKMIKGNDPAKTTEECKVLGP